MKALHFLKHVLLVVGAAAVVGITIMLLWNWLVPGIFGWRAIGYWEAIGLFLLSKLLFGYSNPMRHWHHRDHSNPIHEKWMRMSPEEQKEYIERRRELMKEHHHHHGGWHRRPPSCSEKGNE